jgi:ribosomal protein S18 acetylase RimI-like enzyme
VIDPSLIRDPFIESFLGKPCFQLNPCDHASNLFQSGDSGFVYTKVKTSKTSDISRLERIGFNLIDTSIQLRRSTSESWDDRDISSSCRIELAEPSDLPDVERIAASSFLFSRFHLDPKIEDSVANEIKRQWATNFFAGKRGDCMVVAKDQNHTIGFALLLDQDDKRTIDLIAVSKRHRGKGLASAMIRFAAKEALGRQIVVGTQVANFPSLRSYENLGFRIYDSYYVLHYHGPVAT